MRHTSESKPLHPAKRPLVLRFGARAGSVVLLRLSEAVSRPAPETERRAVPHTAVAAPAGRL